MPAILLVDDEPVILTMLALALEIEGCQVLTAGSGAEAISIFRSCRSAIHLLITDVVMPEMGGPALAAALLTEDSGLPVLFMSGSSEVVPFGRSPQFGFVAKPFALQDLLAEVRSLMRREVAGIAGYSNRTCAVLAG
jgi:DNA-binding response OmpR family regulator